MKWMSLLAILGVFCFAGCASTREQCSWARTLHEATGVFPKTETRLMALGNNVTMPFTVTYTDAEHGVIDCGLDLKLRILDPNYAQRWGVLSLKDMNGDGIKDLFFTTRLKGDAEPISVIFLYTPEEWERYYLPRRY